MAFDACMMRATLSEFSREFPEAKIEKVVQPANDEIDLLIHHGRSSRRLLFNVGPNAPRLQLTDIAKENPQNAPMFCMFLRKKLTGARIVGVRQPSFDRIAEFSVMGYDEMGFQSEMKIVCEIMGKYANLILLDSERRVLNALKIIDFSASTVRQVLPGLSYQAPGMQDKKSPLIIDEAGLRQAVAQFPREKTVEKLITGYFSGVATQIAHELCFRACGACDQPLESVNTDALVKVILDWQRLLIDEAYTPTVAIDKTGKPIDYSYMNISYLGDYVQVRSFDSISALFDMYFAEKDRLERIHQRARDVSTLLNNARARTERKLAIQREALAESRKGGEYKKYGDLITANIYRIKKGDESLTAVDYYDESCPEIRIPLDTRLTPAANAQRMYKLYNKAKKAKEVLTEQIAIWEAELHYIDSVKGFLESAECEQDLADIRDELYKAGYASRMRGYKPPKISRSKPMTFKTDGGFTVLVGRNNLQNDRLTLKDADKDDIWFHTKDYHGSHVIMVTDGREPSELDYTQAAELAAGYSQAKADLVAVDYTRVKYVKKPAGSKPGFVTYKTYYTAYVKPRKTIH